MGKGEWRYIGGKDLQWVLICEEGELAWIRMEVEKVGRKNRGRFFLKVEDEAEAEAEVEYESIFDALYEGKEQANEGR